MSAREPAGVEITVAHGLLLRELTADDEAAFLAYRADPRSTAYYGPNEGSPERARELLRLFLRWAAERPRANYQLAIAGRGVPHELVGCCGLRGVGAAPGAAEFGIELAPARWGRGWATAAARALLAFGFRDLTLREVRATSVDANARVAGLLRRLGFVAVGARPGPAWMRARGWSETAWRLARESPAAAW